MPLIDKQAAADGDEAAMEDAMAAEVDEAADADGKMITEEDGDSVIISTMVSTLLTITEASRGTNVIHWDPKVAPPPVLSMRDRTQERAGRTGGGRDGGGRGRVTFQDGDNERTISTAIVEYDAYAPPATGNWGKSPGSVVSKSCKSSRCRYVLYRVRGK
jgi:hypothetical protein